MVGGLHPHPHRTMGPIPYALAGAFGCCLWGAVADDWWGPAVGALACLAVTLPGLATGFEVWGRGPALVRAAGGLAALAAVPFAIPDDADRMRRIAGWTAVGVAFVTFVYALWTFRRSAFEVVCEMILAPLYRVRAFGPGLDAMPNRGPFLVIANHGALFDPMWVSAPMKPPARYMMISIFYDLPVVSWLMRRVCEAIRVQDSPYRTDAPELRAAAECLDRGDAVLIFPEGWLRRKEEVELRRFARGAWAILAARPATVVYPCWVEGNWGTAVSHKDGPPCKKRKIDFWHRITVAFGEPFVVPPEILAKHMKTRLFLMDKVIAARSHIAGLPPIKLGMAAEEGGES